MKIKWTFLGILCIIIMCLSACQKEEADPCKKHEPKEDCHCTYQWDPVCGCDSITYSNPCAAECEGVYTYTKGKCEN